MQDLESIHLSEERTVVLSYVLIKHLQTHKGPPDQNLIDVEYKGTQNL